MIESIYDRLQSKTRKRPLVKGLNGIELKRFITDKLYDRRKYYYQADIVIRRYAYPDNVINRMDRRIRQLTHK